MSKTVSIVLTGTTGLRNRGVEALVASSAQEFRKLDSETHLTVLTRDYEYDALRGSDLGIHLLRDPYRQQGLLAEVRETASKAAPALWRQGAALKRCVLESSAVVASGGDVFSSDYGDALQHLKPLKMARQLGKPCFLLAHSIGPFQNPDTARRIKDALEETNLITVRESHSYRYLVDELKVSSKKVVQTADPAFLLEPACEDRVEQLWNYYGLRDEPTVAMAVSQGICGFGEDRLAGDQGDDAHRHIESLAVVARRAMDEYECQILLVPHVQERQPRFDDRLIAEALVEKLERDPRARVAWGNHSAAEFKGLIARCDLVFAERMHAAIAGLSSGIPTCVVRYSVKADGIMGDLFDQETQSSAMIPLEDFLDPQQASDVFDRAWQNRDLLRERLSERIPGMKELAGRNFQLIAETIQK